MTLKPCSRCKGTGQYLMARNLHESEGWVPCDCTAWNRRAPGGDHIPDAGEMVPAPTIKPDLTVAYTAGAEAMREAAAELATRRWRDWPGVHPDDAQPGQVCDDVSACADIAAAIRALPLPEGPKP